MNIINQSSIWSIGLRQIVSLLGIYRLRLFPIFRPFESIVYRVNQAHLAQRKKQQKYQPPQTQNQNQQIQPQTSVLKL